MQTDNKGSKSGNRVEPGKYLALANALAAMPLRASAFLRRYAAAMLRLVAPAVRRLYRLSRIRWRRGGREYLPVMIVLAAGILLSGFGFFASRHYLENAAQHEFVREGSHHVSVVQNSVDRHLEAVRSATRFVSGDEGEFNRWSFFEFADGRLPFFEGIEAFPGVKTLQWIPRVDLDQRADYEAEAQSDGLFGFSISERNFGEGLVIAGSRPEYYPVYYVNPLEGNEESLGFDMASIPQVLEALEKARDTASLTVTEELPLAIGDTVRRAVLVIDPVYQARSAPESVDDRRADLKGFMLGIIDPVAIVDRTIDLYTTPAWLDMYLYDETSNPRGASLLHYRPSSLRRSQSWPITLDEVKRSRHLVVDHAVGSNNWSIVVAPVPGRINFETSVTPYGVGAFGVVLTLILAGYFVTLRSRRRMIEEKVAERTAELSAANRSLASEVQERRRVARALRKAKEEAEVANHAKSGFLAMISHELRTPLNAIIGFSEVLSEQMFGPLGHKNYSGYASDIRNSGRHLLGLINNILDLTKVEANEFDLRRQDMDLAEAIDDVLRLFDDQAHAAAQSIELDLEMPLPILRADPGAIRQILINLLSNALKFTPEGGSVDVSTKLDEDGQLRISVSDNGIGIEQKHLDGIFQPFSQVDSSLARKYEGTGLGLPLTKSLVQLHGGNIEIESVPGHGTTVHVVFGKDMVKQQGSSSKTSREIGPGHRLDLH